MDINDTEIVSSTNNSNAESAYGGFEDLFVGTIPTKQLKQFALTFQCMSKFGNEMTFEVTPNCLLMRVLNDAKTVFLTFRFGVAFFEKYQIINENDINSSNINPISTDGRSLKFKAILKPFTAILRSLRTVERLELIFSENTQYSTLTFRLHCQRGILKTHIFQVERTDIYHVVFDRRNDGPNKFLIKPKTLLNILDQIHGAEEIIIRLDRSSARVLSHHHNFDESSVSVASEVDIPITELENRIFNNCPNEGLELIVCLKEIKYFLSYCSAPEIVKHNLNAQIYFNQNGSPMLFSTKGAHRAEMILATVADINNGGEDEDEEEAEMMMPGRSISSAANDTFVTSTSSITNQSIGNNNTNNNNIYSYNADKQEINSNNSSTLSTKDNSNNSRMNKRINYNKKKRKATTSDINNFNSGVNQNESNINTRLFGHETESQSQSKLDTTFVVDNNVDDDEEDSEEIDIHNKTFIADNEQIDSHNKTLLIESMVPSSQ